MASKNKKTIIQVVIIIIMFTSAGTIFYNNFVKEKNQSADIEIVAPDLSEDSEDNFEDAIQIFDKEAFKSLIKFGDWPLQIVDKGRPNPFLKI
ncbi:MAG TPA: hypothetical protein PLH37_02855 [bacterium]|nr:hypothetical protein [bacterium]